MIPKFPILAVTFNITQIKCPFARLIITHIVADNVGPPKEMVAAMVIADPSKTEEEHLFALLHSSHGRSLANHLNNLAKKDSQPMSRTEEMQEMHKFVKSTPGGMTSIAKRVISEGGTSLTENEYADLWKAEAGGTVAFGAQSQLRARPLPIVRRSFERSFCIKTLRASPRYSPNGSHR
jgi:hypothetical protein